MRIDHTGRTALVMGSTADVRPAIARRRWAALLVDGGVARSIA